MEPAQPTNHLPEYIRTALAHALGASGRRLSVTAESEISDGVELRYATDTITYHRLRYAEQLRPHEEHLVLDAATRIRRVWESPRESRVASRRNSHVPKTVADDLREWAEEHAEGMQPRSAYNAVCEAVIRLPGDLRVARQIVDRYPEHAESLLAYTRDRMDWLTVADAMYHDLPESLDRPLQGMRAAHSLELNDILGGEPFEVDAKHAGLGQSLADKLYIGIPQGHQGDVVATELWASEFGLEQTYRWVRLDE